MMYGLENRNEVDSHMIVIDIGGGTSDIAIMHMQKGAFHVKGNKGDMHLGG